MTADLLNTLPIGCADLKPVWGQTGEIEDFEILSANTFLAALFHAQDAEALVGQRFFVLNACLKTDEVLSLLVNAAQNGVSGNLKIRPHEAPDKTFALRTAKSKNGCAVTLQDITNEVRDFNDLIKNLSVLQHAWNNAVEGVVVTTETSEIIFVNKAFCTLTGYDKDELIGQSVGKLFHPDDFETDKTAAADLKKGVVQQIVKDKRYLAKNGEIILVSVALSIVWDERYDGYIFIGNIRDVREERRISHELKEALAQAEEATRLKSMFLANISHEIRTPLNGVIGMAQVLAHSGLTPAQNDQITIIKESGETLMSLINDILDLSKIEAGKLDISVIDADIRHKLRTLYNAHETFALKKGLDFQLIVDPAVPAKLLFDPVRVRQCLDNLISNALKFTSEGSVIVAVAYTAEEGEEGLVQIKVSDTGIGVAPDKQDRIFNAFQQADGSTTRNFGGTGLGLAITRRLAELMGGALTMESEEGRGSTFTLTFRAKAAALTLAPDVERLGDPGAVGAKQHDLAGLKALIVDDNDVNRRIAELFLAQHGVVCAQAENGLQALDRLAKEAFDFVLLDVQMPVMDGVETIRNIRGSEAAWRDMPVIALTADAMSGDSERYLEAGMNGYVSKPVSEDSLIAEIGRVLEKFELLKSGAA